MLLIQSEASRLVPSRQTSLSRSISFSAPDESMVASRSLWASVAETIREDC